MVGIEGEKVILAQENGTDVELIVSGTEIYATYRTPEGYPAVYDDDRGLFCYARVEAGELRSTGIPVTGPPPSGVERGAAESDEVRDTKIRKRREQMERNAHPGRSRQH